MFLDQSETVRGSGDDLEVFYFQIKQQANFVARNAFGRRVCGEEAVKLGGQADVDYRVALCVQGMGDKNGVAISQAVHEAILQLFGCLKEGQWMRYKRGTPLGSVWEGAYIDDHVVAEILGKESLRCTSADSL